ncbi:hypothetical protein [Pseudopelagicola sp. nBUS_19]|uniref:hypothetical protein n=1 Tax=Pseudopelagicola sp. nBUS_19 TaxID=3395316 RepID=UPI003EB827BC
MKFQNNTLVVDLDDTISRKVNDYETALVNRQLVEKLQEYRERGFQIIIHTSRNMRSYEGDISKIQLNTLPKITEWLSKYNVPVDGIITGKPWCGENGFYIDNRAVRPSEFVNLSYSEIKELIEYEDSNTFS